MAESVTPHPAIEAKREKESFAEEHLRNVAQVHPPYSYMNTPSRGEHTSFMRRHTIASAKDTKTTRRTRNFYAKTTIASANAPPSHAENTHLLCEDTPLQARKTHKVRDGLTNTTRSANRCPAKNMPTTLKNRAAIFPEVQKNYKNAPTYGKLKAPLSSHAAKARARAADFFPKKRVKRASNALKN